VQANEANKHGTPSLLLPERSDREHT
jgi:hypothetical protein